jgi:hypothetical protein
MANDLAALQATKDKITALGKEIDHQRSEFEKSIAELVGQQKAAESEYAIALRAELASLGQTASSNSHGAARRTRAPRGSSEIVASQVFDWLEKVQGEKKAGEIASGAGLAVSPNTLSLVLKKLSQEGRIVKSGERSQTVYRVR